jgi:hypothetical protein
MEHGPWTMDHRPWTTEHGPRTMDHGPWTTDHGPRTTDHGTSQMFQRRLSGHRLRAEPRRGIGTIRAPPPPAHCLVAAITGRVCHRFGKGGCFSETRTAVFERFFVSEKHGSEHRAEIGTAESRNPKRAEDRDQRPMTATTPRTRTF